MHACMHAYPFNKPQGQLACICMHASARMHMHAVWDCVELLGISQAAAAAVFAAVAECMKRRKEEEENIILCSRQTQKQTNALNSRDWYAQRYPKP